MASRSSRYFTKLGYIRSVAERTKPRRWGRFVLIAAVGGITGNALTVHGQASLAHDVPAGASTVAAPVPTRRPPSPPAPPTLACPTDMARIGKLCIDRYEAHLVIVVDGKESRHPYSSRPPRRAHYEARSAKGVKPQGYISRLEAERACNNAGKRLCTLDEWQSACRGSRDTDYPYGNEEETERCNVGKGHLMSKLFGEAPDGWTQARFNDAKLNEEPGYLAKTGAYETCVTPEGLHDMVGNLHEWVDAEVTMDLMRKLRSEGVRRHGGPWRRGNSVFMGGFFSTTNEHGKGCQFITIAHEARYHDYSTGFRCCAAAQAR